MKIQFMQGKSNCERCGQYIKNIYVITFNDGYSITVGCECIKKVMKETNLTEKGCNYIEKLMKPIEKLRKNLAMWENMTYEKALKKKILMLMWDNEAETHRVQTETEYEETRKRMLEYLPKQLKKEEEKMNEELKRKLKNFGSVNPKG